MLATPVGSALGSGLTVLNLVIWPLTQSRLYYLIAPSSAYLGKLHIYPLSNSHLLERIF